MRGAFAGGQTERSSFDISSNLALVSALIRAVAAFAVCDAEPVEKFAPIVACALPVVAPLVMNDCAMAPRLSRQDCAYCHSVCRLSQLIRLSAVIVSLPPQHTAGR